MSFELRKGTKTRPFLLALPNALMHSARASKDLQQVADAFVTMQTSSQHWTQGRHKDLHQIADTFVTMQNFITAPEPMSQLVVEQCVDNTLGHACTESRRNNSMQLDMWPHKACSCSLANAA